jgi:hypothetical protein
MKLGSLQIWGAFLVLLESPRRVRFNRFYFTIFRAKMWKILIFELILLLEIQTNYQKNWVWKEKISFRALNVFTLGHRLHTSCTQGEGVQEVSPLTPCGLIMGESPKVRDLPKI